MTTTASDLVILGFTADQAEALVNIGGGGGGGGGGGITALTGDVTASGSGSVTATLASTGVGAGSYTNSNLTIDGKGRITAAASGSAGTTVVSGTATVTVPGRGQFQHIETVAATGITGSMKIVPAIGDHEDTDENSAEMLSINAMEAEAGTDQITFRLSFGQPESGPIKVNYFAV